MQYKFQPLTMRLEEVGRCQFFIFERDATSRSPDVYMCTGSLTDSSRKMFVNLKTCSIFEPGSFTTSRVIIVKQIQQAKFAIQV